MYRMVTASLILVASTAFCSAQELIPSEWKSQHGAFLKALYGSPASFTGTFITGPGGPCPEVSMDLAGQAQGLRVAFETTRATPDCRLAARWSGRFVSPTTLAVRWAASYVAPDGHVARMHGTEVFQRL